MKKIIIALVLVYSSVSFSQIKLSGKVVNHENIPIDLAEVLLINEDSISQKSELTNSKGEFILAIVKGNYLLQIRQFGKKLYSSKINLTQELDLGNIKTNQKNEVLTEVVVQGKKKLIERKVDRLIFNVENSISATGGDALDALKVTPGILVKNDAITMINKSGLTVMIDERLIQLSGDDLINYLKTISSDNISKIEVITTPPAKYDAQGNSGMINIKLKKTIKNTWNSTLRGSYTQASYGSKNIGGNFNFNKYDVLINSNVTFLNNTMQNIYESKQYYPTESWISRQPNKINPNPYVASNILIEYQINKKIKLGAQYIANYIDSKSIETGKTLIFNESESVLKRTIEVNAESKVKNPLNSINLYSEYVLDSLQRKININFDYFNIMQDTHRNYSSNERLTIDESIINHDKSNNTGIQDIKNYSGKIDVEYPLKWANLEFGGKTSSIKSNNDLTYNDIISGVSVLNNNLSNKFYYTENLNALYVSANKKWSDKWSVQMGLRFENTNTRGFSFNLNQFNNTNYSKFFPTGYITYNPNQNTTFSINYAKRINRPNYEQLNPFRIKISNYDVAQGNPFLEPSFNDNFEISYNYKQKWVSTLSYSKLINGFQQIAIIDSDTNQRLFIPLNYYEDDSFGITESYTINKWSWWESTNIFRGSYHKTKSLVPFTVLNMNGLLCSIGSDNTFNLNTGKTIFAGLNYIYEFPGQYDLSKTSASSSLDVSLKLLFLNKKLKIGLSGNDIFKGQRTILTSYSSGIRQDLRGYYDTRSFRISLSYKFGNTKITENYKSTGNEEERQRTGR